MRQFFVSIAFAFAGFPPSNILAAQVSWPAAHLNTDNNAVTAQPAQVTSLAAPAWSSVEATLASGAPATIAAPFVFVPADGNNGVTSPAMVVAINAVNGNTYWRSDHLEPRIFGSFTAAVADPANNAVYYASGSSVYRLNMRDGRSSWTTTISGANTTTSPTVQSWEFINSSPQLGGGKIFIETFGGFTPSNKQLIALNQNTGSVAWFKNDVGQGNGTPVFVADANGGRVYSAGLHSMRCYRATDGALRWDSITSTPATWNTGTWDIFASPTHANGKIYTVGSDKNFVASTATLVCADALTGAKIWQRDAPVSDCPPLILNGRVYIYGGGFPGRLAAYDANTGTPVFNVVVAPFSFVFRNYMAASTDRIYMTDGNGIMIINPADGAVLSRRNGLFAGAVSIDAFGGIYTFDAGFSGPSRLAAFGFTVPVELTNFTIE